MLRVTKKISFALLCLVSTGCDARLSGSPLERNEDGSGFGGVEGGNGRDVVTDVSQCDEVIRPGPGPLRRLTTPEYNNTIMALLLDESRPGSSLPPELSGNGFGNDAAAQPVSSFLVEQYSAIAQRAALDALENEEWIRRYVPCATTVGAEVESDCARSFLSEFLPDAFRRPVATEELSQWLALYDELRPRGTFQEAVAGLVEATLQSPDFLYRVEFGEPTAGSEVLAVTGFEMASRLSYFLWGGPPDDALIAAARSGTLSTPQGIEQEARRLLDDPKARRTIRLFFRKVLPIDGLTDLARDPAQYPQYSAALGAALQTETLTFLEYEIFQGPGDWPSALTAPYTFVNEELAAFYGIEGVDGDEFRLVMTEPTERLGLLSQGSVLAGSTVSNFTNPVRRGVFLLEDIMCQHLQAPPASVADEIAPPDPYSGDTARERYSAHSESPACATCHAVMDPPGFGLENFDALGQWRDSENGVVIDASGAIDGLLEPFGGPLDMIRRIAEHPQTQECFAHQWTTFAAGRTLEDGLDLCLEHDVQTAFRESGYNIKSLLVAITQTDDFRYMTPRGTN